MPPDFIYQKVEVMGITFTLDDGCDAGRKLQTHRPFLRDAMDQTDEYYEIIYLKK